MSKNGHGGEGQDREALIVAEYEDPFANSVPYHDAGDLARIAELEDALRSLIARVRRVGGYATPEEQDDLRRAERVLRSGT